MKSLTPEEVIVLCFAVLGLGGGIALQLMKFNKLTAPAVLIAIGIASLVYGFLGGLGGATFVWGAIKAGGSLGALLCTFVVMQHYLKTDQQIQDLQQLLIPTDQIKYEWQWAGENWLNHIDVSIDAKTRKGTAKIYGNRLLTHDGKLEPFPGLEPQGDGTAQLSRDCICLDLEIPVKFIQYDGCVRTGIDQNTTVLRGTLRRKIAYAGTIIYGDASRVGDMVLVNYDSQPHPW